MSVLTLLPEDEQARQLGRPEGETGLALAEWLNGYNRPFILAGRAALGLRKGSRVLEIGFGNGHDVAELLAMAEDVHYTGLDISGTMVAEARRHNAELVAAGRAAFVQADITEASLAPGSFDHAIAINVIYFWADPVPPLATIRRLLAPGGALVNGCADNSGKVSAFAKPEYGFHLRSLEEVLAAHRAAGFAEVTTERVTSEMPGPSGAPITRTYNIIVARG
jgi:SAM-dependent methyltransferase